MTRLIGSSGQKTMEAIRKAGLQLIYEHGFEAVSLRQLAKEVGIQQGSLYNHIPSKQELLFDLIKAHMGHLLSSLDGGMQGTEGWEPREQIKKFVEFHVQYHVHRKREVFISYSELRSLTHDNYESIVVMRRQYERQLVNILERGVAAGQFQTSDPQVAAYGIISMLAGISSWYNPEGRLKPADLAELYTKLVLNGLSVDG